MKKQKMPKGSFSGMFGLVWFVSNYKTGRMEKFTERYDSAADRDAAALIALTHKTKRSVSKVDLTAEPANDYTAQDGARWCPWSAQFLFSARW